MHPEFTAGLDLGGTALKAVRVDRNGGAHRFFEIPSRALESAKAPLDAIAEALATLESAGPLAHVGLGCPGAVDVARGVLVGRTPHLPHWEDWPIREAVRSLLGREVVVDNDANLAALAEHRLGAARGCRSSLTVTIGTGIGCGIVIDDRIWHGAWGGAGEIGHVPLGSGEAACRCGIPGCVEPEASGEGLAREAVALGLDPPDARGVFEAAGSGHLQAIACVAHFTDRLGAVIGSAVNLLNPECVVIGGGVVRAGDALMLPLRKAIERYALPSHWKRLRVVAAALGQQAGCIGAGLLAWDAIEGGGG